MSRKWTAAQSAAIDTRDKSLLVCAAAGSGKTATLTERIITSLTDKENPVDIDRMLIVTFTRAAAAELKQRISASLSEALAADPQNKRLTDQIIKMSSANICTIDAFYLDIIRSNFDKLDISPSFRTADTAELDVLAKSLMEDSVDHFYEERGDAFSHIAECFVNVRNGENLSNIFLSLYFKAESLPEGIDFIKLSAEKAERDSQIDFFEGSFGSLICSQLIEKFEYYKNVFEDFLREDSPLSSVSALIYDKLFAEKFIEILKKKNYEECHRYINSYMPIKLPVLSKLGIDNAEDFKNIRNKFKKYVAHVTEHTFSFRSAEIKEVLLKTADVTYSLYDLLCDFKDRFDKEKKQKNVLSFSDIRRYAMQLLVDEDERPTRVALEYAKKYTQIYIDEYQDVDRVQDIIFRSIASPSARFMVGDIKQSIYGFRGAEPSVFASYRKSFPDINSDEAKDSGEVSIFMSNNFRCDKPVIDFANCVCSYVFSECAESMGYTAADDLICSKIVEDRQIAEVPTELAVIVPDTSQAEDQEDEEAIEESNKELEAKYIANKIRELLKSGKKADGSPILPHDVAVLFRTSTMGEYVSRALKSVGIDCSNETDSNYFENPDVLLVLCLLNVIDNPQRDIYLAGLLRSPFFDFSLDELIRIRRSADSSYSLYDALKLFREVDEPLGEKCRAFDNTLSDLRKTAASLSVDKLLRHLYSSELFIASGLVNSDDSNNLLRLYEYARNFESSSFKGLYNFIVYINRLIEKKTKLNLSSSSTNEGKVSLMTIHKSKGLEFPVCFVCNAGAPFNLQETRESLVCVAEHGIAMKISDGSGYARLNTPMRDCLIEAVKTMQTEEEMRVLYVALTRARERLFVTASSISKKDALLSKAAHNRTFKCAHTVRSARSYLDWILSAVDPEIEHDFCKLSFIEKSQIANINVIENVEVEENQTTQTDTCDLLKERFSFVYPYKKATELPAKISVSALLDYEKDEESVELFASSYEKEYTAPLILEGGNAKDKKESASASKRGTATHLFLQFCDFGNAKRRGVGEELYRLIEKKFIPKESKDLIFCDELCAFFESELFKKIEKAKRITREQRFNILLPPEVLNNDPEFVKETEGEFLAVQGVIDLIIEDENGDIFLYDYKTDRLSSAELYSDELLVKKMTDRHAAQLNYYKEAVRRLFGKECKAAFIYSTHAAKEIEI